ncbi:MAG: HYR domain-containing protein [Chitinophagaceae bacterium]
MKKLSILVAVLFIFFTSSGQYVINGNAFNLGGNSYRLTQATQGQGGSVWFQNKISLASDLIVDAEINLGTSEPGADGMAFVLQPVCSGLGGVGGGLGYFNLSPSLAVEFDTYQNTDRGDPANDHIGLMKNGNVGHTGPSGGLINSLQTYTDLGQLEDGAYHPVHFIWTAGTKNLKVFVDGILRVNYTDDIVANIFSGNRNVFWGFTAATGAAYNVQIVHITSSSFTQEGSFTVTKPTCPDYNNGAIDLNPAGGIGPFTYAWSNGATTEDISGLSAGLYTVAVTDGSGCKSNFSIPVENQADNTPPTARCKNATVNLVGGAASIVAADIDNGSFDNCGDVTLSVSPSTFSCANTGANTVTLTVRDAAGNTSTCTATVTVVDNTPPVITCAPAVAVDNDPGICGAVVNYQVTATDDCLPPTSLAGYTYLGGYRGHTYLMSNNMLTGDQVNAAALAAGTGAHLVSIGDAAENAFILSVAPTTFWTGGYQNTASPAYSEPAGGWEWTDGTPFTYTNWQNGEPNDYYGNATEQYLEFYAGIGTWNDEFTARTLKYMVEFDGTKIVQTSGLPSGSVFPVGTTTNTFVATDASGNTSTCSFDVTVKDTENPSITCNDPIVTNNDQGVCGAAVSYTISSSDNCPGQVVTQTGGLVSGSVFPVGTTTNTFVVRDAAGNTATCSFDVTVKDTENPTINCNDPIVTNNDQGVCGAAVSYTISSSDNCPGQVVTQTTGLPSGAVFPVGTTTNTFEVRDAAGNTATCSFTVTVKDIEAPIATCKAATVTLVNGAAGIVAADIDNGSSDNCGTVTLSIPATRYTCSDIGNHTVTLTVQDAAGNRSTCDATVTVVGERTSCTIASKPTSNVYTGGVSTNLYLGYGAQSTVLQVTASGGTSFTYSWTPGTGLSNTNTANPTFTPTAGGTYNFTVLVTNNFGCTTTCSIKICVLDIRVLDKNGLPNGKVHLCHLPPGNPGNPQSLEISTNAVPAHLGNHTGDRLGKCSDLICSGAPPAPIAINVGGDNLVIQEGLVVKVSPNPSNGNFTVKLVSSNSDLISVRIISATGQALELKNSLTPGTVIKVGDAWKPGSFLLEAIQGKARQVVKLIKL